MRIQEDVRTFIVDNFLFGEDRGLQNDSSFLESGILDSTGIMQLVSFISEVYSINVEDEDIVPENLDSINKVAGFIERKRLQFPLGFTLSGT